RFCATAAIPAVRHEARPTSTYSTGVAPLSSEAKIAGWSASYLNSVLCDCSLPRPKKLCTVERLWVPRTQLQLARHLNCAASGVSVSAWRAPSRASTLTPLSTVLVVVVTFISSDSLLRFTGDRPAIRSAWRTPVGASVGIGKRGRA